jgi:negative regulator of flagellin synthesis FlgM
MKVSNGKIGGAGPKLDVKGAKSDAASILGKDSKLGALDSKNIKGSANVDVSDRAQMMQKAKSLAGDQSIDEAKVSRLQKLIDEGKYKVDAGAIADRLVDEHLMTSDD